MGRSTGNRLLEGFVGTSSDKLKANGVDFFVFTNNSTRRLPF